MVESNFLITKAGAVVTLLMLLWMNNCTVRGASNQEHIKDTAAIFGEKPKHENTIVTRFPNRIHIILLTALSFLPIIGLLITIMLVSYYVINRVRGDLKIKRNKFTNFLFK